MFRKLSLVFGGLLILGGCATNHQVKQSILTPLHPPIEAQKPKNIEPSYKESGMASWYGPGFNHKKTASGEIFDQNKMTAAHKYLPLGTQVVVKNTDTGKTTLLKITDRGPFSKNRILDVSKGAAVKLGMLQSGTSKIELKVYGDQLPEEVAESLE